MKFTLSWLKEHLDTDAPIEAIGETLTAIGLEVEDIIDKRETMAPFKVCMVIAADPHPNADKLRVCQVDAGEGPVQVVCGAPNARAGMKGVFAPSGSTIPGTGLKLKPTAIRGVDSNGMLVSEREMGLSDEHEGIIEMPQDTPVGTPFAEALGLDDPVIEIAITPNRQDCLGVRGVARDLAAAGLGKLKPAKNSAVSGSFKSPVGVALRIGDGDTCPLFVGRALRGLKNGPSPDWLQRKLMAIGLRPISALVDITNYLTFDRARPLHVYDMAKLSGDIHVRLSQTGETLMALDGNEYALEGSECVIADDSGAIGLGGVMGGERTGCTEQTTDVFVEAALFDPVRTAATGRKLGIESDARYRFERGVDPEYTAQGMEDATRLILELCGGEASELVIAGQVPQWNRTVTLRAERMAGLCGLDISAKQCREILGALGFESKEKKGLITAEVPSWRSDVDGEADLIEEIARIYGYDKIPSVPLSRPSPSVVPALDKGQRNVRLARRVLAASGLNEAATWSFTSSKYAALFGGVIEETRLENPISSELDVMRPSLLPNLLAAAKRNQDRGFDSLALFEVGSQYAGDRPEDQQTAASGLRTGERIGRHWSGPAAPISVFDAKSDALGLLETLRVPVSSLQLTPDAPSWYHPGRSGTLRLGPKTIVAVFGEIHPRVIRQMDLTGPVAAFEVYLDALAPSKRKTARPALKVSDLPVVERDFAFILDRGVHAQDLIAAVRGADNDLIESVSVFDVYEGPGIPEGKKSLAVSVRLQPREKTLTDSEIEAVSAQIISATDNRLGAKLRL